MNQFNLLFFCFRFAAKNAKVQFSLWSFGISGTKFPKQNPMDTEKFEGMPSDEMLSHSNGKEIENLLFFTKTDSMMFVELAFPENGSTQIESCIDIRELEF